MKNSKAVSPKENTARDRYTPVGDADLQRLADFVKFPDGPVRDRFFLHVQGTVEYAWFITHDRDLKIKASRALVTAVRHAKAFSNGLGVFSDDERDQIGEFFDHMKSIGFFGDVIGKDESYCGFEGYRELVWRLIRTAALFTSVGIPTPLPLPFESPPGRKLGPSALNYPFQSFAGSLFACPALAASKPGEPLWPSRHTFTFKKSPLSGTWIDAINLLKGYVPAGVIPRCLPATTLERIRKNLICGKGLS